MKIKRDGAEIFYDVRGKGAPVVLLHPFPVNHHFWNEVTAHFEDQYQLILPDLRAHGQLQPGEGAATMEKHALDMKAICDDVGIRRAVFVGVSIGGYILFEFWRQFRDRVQALVLANTRAGADSPEAREGREKSIEDLRQRGPVPFIEAMVPKLIGESTRRMRLDRVEAAHMMMSQMNVAGLTAALQGLAARPDSTLTLKTVDVPTLLIAGNEDTLTPVAEAQLMRLNITRSWLEVIPRAGHYAAMEQPEDFARLLGKFLESTR